MKKQNIEIITLQKVVNGGQALGELTSGKKCFVWGGLPGEVVKVRLTKQKSSYAEGIVEEVLKPSSQRISPRDPDSYLSTSPWQMIDFALEQQLKADLIHEAFEPHHIQLPHRTEVFTNYDQYNYRNKVEFSWYSDTISGVDTLDLAFFKRGSKGKIVVNDTSLARPEINRLAQAIRDLLRTKPISARNLKTLLIRCNQQGDCVWQLYLKDKINGLITPEEAGLLPARGGEIIYSNPKSPASVITERLSTFGDTTLTDTILGVPFNYACEGFFQVNLPIYEQALRDISNWISVKSQPNTMPVLDLYSGVGTIGLTVGSDNTTLVEINENAVREMRRNISQLKRTSAKAILAASEQALDYITPDEIVIVDPPRAGLHTDVISKLLAAQPPRIIYLSCNPLTQARDVALLLKKYHIIHHRGYNFFPRTPHIENLIILDKIDVI